MLLLELTGLVLILQDFFINFGSIEKFKPYVQKCFISFIKLK